MGASGTAYSRGLSPSRVGIGGRYREPDRRGGNMPGSKWQEATKQTAFRSNRFRGAFAISGVTRDSTGVALGNCEVDLFHSASDVLVLRGVSDGAGNYSFVIGNNSDFYYVRAYKAGAPDLAGTTINALMATYTGG